MRFNRLLDASITKRADIGLYCRFINASNAARGWKHRISPARDEVGDIHIADDGSEQIYICRRGRHTRYKRGVMAGVDRLAADYSLDRLSDLRDGLFLDCGANVGELGFWARSRGFRYMPFEPEALEARCVDLNHFGGSPECVRKALWKENTTLTFFQRADSADSSVLPGSKDEANVSVEAVALDSMIDLLDSHGPVILKLEAEGAEPEVLEGASQALRRIDWVAVDCGFERGPEKAHTLVETNNLLQDAGFKLVAAKLRRVTALYKRVGT